MYKVFLYKIYYLKMKNINLVLLLLVLLGYSLITQFSNISYASNNENDDIELISNHIIWNKTQNLITVYYDYYDHGITFKDKNIGAENIWDVWWYYKRQNSTPIEDMNNENFEVNTDDFPWTTVESEAAAYNDWYNMETFLVTDVEERQWICSGGYHMPSQWEITHLNSMRHSIKTMDWLNDNDFTRTLKLPKWWIIVQMWENKWWIVNNDKWFLRLSWIVNGNPYIYTYGDYWTDSRWAGTEKIWTNIRCFKNTWMETIFLNVWDKTYLTQYEHGDLIETGSLSWLVNLQKWYHIDLYIDELKETKYDSDTINWTITLYWEISPNSDTEYTVQHKVESLEWDEYELIEEETLAGPTDWIATWEYKNYEWFSGLSIEDKTISWDNSTIVEVKYSRNSHSLTIDWDTISAKYWSEIILSEWVRDWFYFIEWQWLPGISWDNKYYMPDYDVVITWIWEKNIVTPASTPTAAGGGRAVIPVTQKEEIKDKGHNVAEENSVEESVEEINSERNEVKKTTIITPITEVQTIEEKVEKKKERILTRWEVAVMTNILLEVYPQLKNTHQELNEVTYACSNYADEQNFTKDEKRAITRLCKLSIMWIHNNTDKPLDEFMVNQSTTNDEFAKVINRTIENYNEKDFSVVKEALRKLEWDEENVVFWTVYDVFMSIKNIFN